MSGPTTKGRVLVVGDVMTDIIVRPEGSLVIGTDRRATIRSHPGGSGANQAVWLASHGLDVWFVARVGEGDRERLEDYFGWLGVSAVLAGDADLPSGVLVTIIAPDGERSFLTDRGANLRLCSDDLPEGLLDEVQVLLVSGYSFFAEAPRAAVRMMVERAKKRDVMVVIDAASSGFIREVGTEAFLSWTEGASLLLANEDEAELLSDAVGLDAQMQELGARFGRVVIKRGAAGAALGNQSGVLLEQAAPVVPVVDTTGAGDAFAAGFVAAHLRGEDEAGCLVAGVEAGSKAVQMLGGRPS